MITLTDEDRQFIETAIQSGHYATPSDAIAEALSALRSRKEGGGQFEEFRAKIQIGLEQLDRSVGIDWNAETVKKMGRSLLESQRRASQ